jgi:hypothetical protein
MDDEKFRITYFKENFRLNPVQGFIPCGYLPYQWLKEGE